MDSRYTDISPQLARQLAAQTKELLPRLKNKQNISLDELPPNLANALVSWRQYLAKNESAHQAAAKEVEVAAGRVRTYFEHLHRILSGHEEVIRKRWAKKNRNQRAALLLGAFPKGNGPMPATARSDLTMFKRDHNVCEADWQHKRPDFDTLKKHMCAYMFPQLNLEDLCDSDLAMRLLNSRGRNPPASFAGRAALERSRRCEAMGVIPKAHESPATLAVKMGEGPLAEYGAVIDGHSLPVSTTELAFGAGTGRMPLYEGLYVLRMQEFILKFVVGFAQDIIHDIHEFGPPLPEPPSLGFYQGQCSDAADLATERQYQVPGEICLGRIIVLAQARYIDARDHAWAVREDPKYFTEYLQEWAEHSKAVGDRSHVTEENSRQKATNTVHPFKKSAFWDQMVLEVMYDQYHQVDLWAAMWHQLSEIQRQSVLILRLERTGKEAGRQDVYHRRAMNIKKLQYWIKHQALPTAKGHVTRFCWNSPRLISWMNRLGMDPQKNRGGKISKADHMFYLLWLHLCDEMGYGHTQGSYLHPVDRAAEIVRMVNSETKEAERLTPLATEAIVNLGLITETVAALEEMHADGTTAVPDLLNFSPELLNFWHGLGLSAEELEKHLEEWVAPYKAPTGDLLKASFIQARDPEGDPTCRIQLGKDGKPTTGRFHYPVHKKRSQQNVKAMQTAEANLDALWNKYDDHVKSLMPERSYAVMRRFQPMQGQLQRTPDWVEAEADVLVEPQPAKSKSSPAVAEPFVFSGTSAQDSVFKSPILPLPKTKVKTRKATTDAEEVEADQGVESETDDEEPEAPVFALKAKELRVFTALFYHPSVKDAPAGEIPWDDFLAAMRAIGFDAKKVYGSVWRFVPPTSGSLVTENPINFHEPHPNGKLSFWHARRFGRRLNRAYGLGATSFVGKA